MWERHMKNKSCICGTLIRRGKKIGMIVALYVFMVLFCLLLGIFALGAPGVPVGIVWELADWIVRRLEKDGCL